MVKHLVSARLQLIWLILSVVLTFLPASWHAQALTYTNGIESSSWRFNGSVFECRLTHTLPFYGDAVFNMKAGESATFSLSPNVARLNTGHALLRMAPPTWRHNLPRIELGYVPVTRGMTPVNLGERYAERMLAELNTGYAMEITRAPWYGAESSSKLEVSPIGFREVYARYLGCLHDLLPVNFEQIQRTAIYFGSGLYEPLPPAQKTKLDHIILYAKADPSVIEFYIDGHTDSVDTRADNFLLSENRAKAVSQYLIDGGMPEDQVIVRWHGERYPIVTNETIEGRSQNRRVTIRLERDPALIPTLNMTP